MLACLQVQYTVWLVEQQHACIYVSQCKKAHALDRSVPIQTHLVIVMMSVSDTQYEEAHKSTFSLSSKLPLKKDGYFTSLSLSVSLCVCVRVLFF